MKKFDGDITVFDLQETYPEEGNFSFKIVLNPKKFKDSHNIEVNMTDPDGNQMEVDLRNWGRKVTCSFLLDDSISNGVCVIKMLIPDNNGKKIEKTLHCWVIK